MVNDQGPESRVQLEQMLLKQPDSLLPVPQGHDIQNLLVGRNGVGGFDCALMAGQFFSWVQPGE